MSDAGVKSAAAVASAETGEGKPALSVVQTAGAQLAAARSQAGMSIAQVAEHLKLSQRQVQAIEANDFTQLPKMVIVRGFVRSYARLLKLDPQAVLSCLPEETAGANLDTDLRPTLSTPFTESRTSFLTRTDQTNRKYLIGAGGLAVAALLFLGFQQLEQTSLYRSLFHASTATPVAEPLATPASEAAETLAQTPLAQTPAATTASQAATVATPAPETAAASQALVANPVATSEPAATLPASPVAEAAKNTQANIPASTTMAAGDNSLRLKFKNASWFQLKTASGTVLTAHVAKAGSEETFEVKEPLQLKIGNAAGVEVVLRGEAVALNPAKDSNVANLNVK